MFARFCALIWFVHVILPWIFVLLSWWRHQMETFSALLPVCAGNSPVPGEFPAQRPVTRSFHAFFDLRLNKPLSKQSWGWWFETLSRPLWRHCNVSPGSSGFTSPILSQSYGILSINPQRAGTELSRFNSVSIMVADALATPGHQQLWYWMYKIVRSLS